ncbi:hypothetical protein RRG08_029861 [Elysia crispata]|uniref:Uncharacterized protein n=1 Tax=Elysia crispata TaxID=231223 RepID=A0AAE0YJW1_9GAST|nr:hypothetical protein RRG08_029861 [Elysia crispata]
MLHIEWCGVVTRAHRIERMVTLLDPLGFGTIFNTPHCLEPRSFIYRIFLSHCQLLGHLDFGHGNHLGT